jgi:hypothetical protein
MAITMALRIATQQRSHMAAKKAMIEGSLQ